MRCVYRTACLVCLASVVAGCVPLPVSTVALHQRTERPVALTSAATVNGGSFIAPAFDASGDLLAVYDSGSDRILILRSADLAPLRTLQATRRPRRLGFSPGGHYLIVEAHAGWIEDHLRGKPATGTVDIHSPAAVRDAVQRAEIWKLETAERVLDFACDAVVASEPKGGWLWARNRAITPGYRSSPLLAVFFSGDESEFSALCWNGVRQRWNGRTWQRLDDIPPPGSWSRAAGLGSAYYWDRRQAQPRRLPGRCAPTLQPVFTVSADGSRMAVVCGKGLGHALHVWDLAASSEIPLQGTEFGLARGGPLIRESGLALSSDGRYLAAALLELAEALVVTPIPAPLGVSRSDLRLWDVATGKELAAVPIDDLIASADYFRGVDLAISPDNAKLAVAGVRLRIYRMSDLGAGPR